MTAVGVDVRRAVAEYVDYWNPTVLVLGVLAAGTGRVWGAYVVFAGASLQAARSAYLSRRRL